MPFESLVQIEPTAAPRKKMVAGLGCNACPAKKYWKRGIKPIMGKVRGKKLFILAQNPGYYDNKDKIALVGDSGDFFWKELKKVGIRRKDCDVQYAVRCMPVEGKDEDTGRWKNRPPAKDEIACCSKYTSRAIRKSRAIVYLIFGDIAARQICGTEFKKAQSIFWSNTLNAKVYVLDQPYTFLRGVSNAKLTAFRVALAAAASEVTGKYKGDPRYAALEKQDYQWITTIEEAEEEARLIRKAAKKGIRVSFDSEEDYLDKYKKRMPLNMSTCFKPGRARNFCIYYPGIKMERSVRLKMLEIVAGLLSDPDIAKVLHHGVSDDNASRKMYGVKIRNFHFDTEYSTFFKEPSRLAFGLKSLADIDYPEFSGYASIIIPWAIPKDLTSHPEQFQKDAATNLKKSQQDQYNFYRKRGMLRYGQIPKKQFNLYACADADLCKRQEIKTKHVSLPLLSIYVDSAWVLNRMEHNGPLFDFKHYKKLTKLYPPKLEKVKKQLAKIAGKDFNPASPPQVYDWVYNKLKLTYPFDLRKPGAKINTQKATMEFLGRTNKFCRLVALFRKLSKIVTTYLESFEKCAIDNDGRLRTKWWLCLAKGELVLTDRGCIPVEDVKKGYTLISHTGKDRKVTEIFYNGYKELIKIKLANGMHLKTTKNHPYLVNGEWLRADELTVGMHAVVYGAKEIWKDVVGHHSNQVSSWGRVRYRASKQIRHLTKTKEGRLKVSINHKYYRVSKLVADAFIPRDKCKPVVRHKNGYNWDNTIGNLKRGTTADNVNDKVLHGTARKCNLSNKDVVYIRAQSTYHGIQTDLAAKFGVSRETIKDIRNYRYRLTSKSSFVQFKTSEIVSVQLVGTQKTYGLSVYKDESHITQGIVTHNTGTQTGRLSSGGTKNESVDTVINLQNVHGDNNLQNQAIADKQWRKCFDYAASKVKRLVGSGLIRKFKKYANDPKKLYDVRDDDTGKIVKEGLISKIKEKLKNKLWQIAVKRILRKYGNIKIFLGFDFGQIEIRILAMLSGDKNLIADCKSGDIHSKVGHTMTGWAIEKIKKDKKTRTLTKNIHFGIAFGLPPDGVYSFILAKDPNISVTREEVHKYYDAYFARYTRIKKLVAKLQSMAEHKGYVENMFEFRRPLNTSQSSSDDETETTGAYWKNQAINTPVQGSAHHMMLMAVAALRLRKKKYLPLLGIPTMEVHDALYFFVRLKNLLKAAELGKYLLEHEPLRTIKRKFKKVKINLPLEVEGKAGFRLGDTVEIKDLSESDALADMVIETMQKEYMLDLELAA